MANRLTKITTRTGDDGSTGLGDGSRIPKSAPRIQVMGEIDELNSQLGLLLTETLPANFRAPLVRIQNQLFDLGAEVCIPGHLTMTKQHVLDLEKIAMDWNAVLPPLKEFILPGGSRSAAQAHVARAVARRAERALVTLSSQEPVSAFALQYLNRLSDLMFILARTLNREAGVPDQFWSREAAAPGTPAA
jgi:cob(I)alamin adenosyltransferase